MKYLYILAPITLSAIILLNTNTYKQTFVKESKKNPSNTKDVITAPAPGPLSTFELPPITIDTTVDEYKMFVLVLNLGYEPNTELENELIRRSGEIIHATNLVIQSKKLKDFDSTEELIVLRKELKEVINLRLMSGKIEEIFLTVSSPLPK